MKCLYTYKVLHLKRVAITKKALTDLLTGQKQYTPRNIVAWGIIRPLIITELPSA